MRNPDYSSVNSQNGDVTFRGPLERMKGDHSNMPYRTEVYLPGDERFHVNASSLGGLNTTSNIVAGHSDVNHGAYLSVEKGEMAALKNGAVIESEKVAVVNSQPGDRPTVFTVNDTITYSDGHMETIHSSFVNESYANQAEWNSMSASLPGNFEAAYIDDGLRDSMGTEEYADLMRETDATLPNLDDDYVPADFSGVPDSCIEVESITDSVSVSEADECISTESEIDLN